MSHHKTVMNDDVCCCNCATCGCRLIGQKSADWHAKLSAEQKKVYPLVAGRVNDRPYCVTCLQPRRKEQARRLGMRPGREAVQAARALEGG